MDLYNSVNNDIRCVFDRWANKETEYYERSCTQFERLVRPAAYYEVNPNVDQLLFANLAYTEWFLFEFALLDGRTPLECFVASPPPLTPEVCVKRLGQVAVTHFFSRFAIREKRVDLGDAILLDLYEGEEYLVHAPELCRKRSWERGSVGLRIACVDGQWMYVGKMLAYDRAPVRPADYLQVEQAGDSRFLSFLHDVIGLGSPLLATCRVVA